MKTLYCLLVLSISWFNGLAQFKYYEQGIKAYQDKDYPGAIKNLNDYLDYYTRDKAFDVDVHYYLALSYFKTQSFTSAVREFDEALQLGHKNTGNIRWFLAKGYGELRVPKQSVDEYTKAIEIITDKTNQAKLYYERAQQQQKLGDSKAAIDDLTTAAKLDGSNEEIKTMLASATAPKSQEKELTAESISKRGMDGKKGAKPEDDKSVAQNTKEVKPPAVQPVSQGVVPPASNNKNDADTKLAEKKDVVVAEKDKPQVVVPVVNDKKTEQKEVASTQMETKQPVVAPPVVIEPKEPTLADLYKDEKRYALVIGNSAYKFVAPLKNSANDANDMAAELEKSNFEVIKVINGDYTQMREAYRKFQEKLSSGPKDQTVGLFYYAGHGIQNEGENYLVPVEANIQYEDDIPRACFPVQRVVVANMERSNSRMNIIVLDACRNNPFPSAYRSTGSGLAEIKRAKGSFIAYATAPGYTASDGEGRNGLYTQELLKAMKKPGRTIEQVFKDVRLNVMNLSGDKQYTWDQSNIIGDFYFKF